MILLAFVAAVLVQWTGPRTVEYLGPGYFCGGGYAVHLGPGERALILPQGRGAQGARLVLGGSREVNVWTGAAPQPGPVVVHYGGTAVTEQRDNGQISYTVSDETGFGLRLTSSAFQGFKRDGWFFAKANCTNGVDDHVPCLAAYSY